MFRKFLRWLNGGDSRSHTEPMSQLDRWDRGTVPLTDDDESPLYTQVLADHYSPLAEAIEITRSTWREGLVEPSEGHGFEGRWGL